MPLIEKLRHIKHVAFPFKPYGPDGFPVDAWTDGAYEEWFRAHKVSPEELGQQRSHSFPDKPSFSIIVPLYETPMEYLQPMVESVLLQTYEHFELILVNASPGSDLLCKAVEVYCETDSRVKEVRLEKNLGITENTNHGISAASGDFLCFLDHDDILEPDILFEYASAINEHPDADVLYCDEDLVSFDDGYMRHRHPLFKPDYSPELLLCKNYIIHMMCIQRALVLEMEKPDKSFDGAQDYNMVLSCAQRARRVYHVPRVLYHWRISDRSTAANPQAKPYSRTAYRKSAMRALSNRWKRASIIGSGIVNIHDVWFTGDIPVRVSVIVACSDASAADRFLQLFSETNSYDRCQLILTGDVSSTEGLNQDGVTLVQSDERTNCFALLNKAVEMAEGDHLVFLDAGDFFLSAEPVEQLMHLLEGEGIGAVAPKTLFSDGTNRCYGIAVTPERIMPLYRGYEDDFPGYQCTLRAMQNVSAASWHGLMVPKDVFLEAGSFDASFEGEIGTADLCERIRQMGYRIVQTPTVKLQTAMACPEGRFDNKTNAPEFTEADLALFDQKWPGLRQEGDPYFNRNLDQSSEYFQIQRPCKER